MRRKVDEPFVKEEDRRVKKGRRFSKINQKKTIFIFVKMFGKNDIL